MFFPVGNSLTSSVFCEVDVHDHITANRGWTLIRDRGQLTAAEMHHLGRCGVCHDWLVRFAAMARKAGFWIGFEIPMYATGIIERPNASFSAQHRERAA
jgi:hypothetical protein